MKENYATISVKLVKSKRKVLVLFSALAVMFLFGVLSLPVEAAGCTHLPCSQSRTYTYTHTNPSYAKPCVIYTETHIKCNCCGKILKYNVEPAKLYKSHTHGVN